MHGGAEESYLPHRQALFAEGPGQLDQKITGREIRLHAQLSARLIRYGRCAGLPPRSFTLHRSRHLHSSRVCAVAPERKYDAVEEHAGLQVKNKGRKPDAQSSLPSYRLDTHVVFSRKQLFSHCHCPFGGFNNLDFRQFARVPQRPLRNPLRMRRRLEPVVPHHLVSHRPVPDPLQQHYQDQLPARLRHPTLLQHLSVHRVFQDSVDQLHPFTLERWNSN
mmetsp:Transcript_127569/g.291574  ORF Transcript_127569/g.291574 Transcript_127569/m.291574 type:complete len:220 (-) Transcript_127569:382-1041(-)